MECWGKLLFENLGIASDLKWVSYKNNTFSLRLMAKYLRSFFRRVGSLRVKIVELSQRREASFFGWHAASLETRGRGLGRVCWGERRGWDGLGLVHTVTCYFKENSTNILRVHALLFPIIQDFLTGQKNRTSHQMFKLKWVYFIDQLKQPVWIDQLK